MNMNGKRFECPTCKVAVVYLKDDVKSHPHCPKCGKNWCPNLNLKWHGPVELEVTVDRRGKYYHCPVCHWYSGIDKESEESVVTQTVFINTLMDCLTKFRDKIDLTRVAFRSILAGEEAWYTLEERLRKYGKVKTTDLELTYHGKGVTKFELKGWKNYDTNLFYFTKRAHVNIDEVEDAAKVDGYICFITLKDKAVICTRAMDIKMEWEKSRVKVPMMPEEDVSRTVLKEFSKGILVVIAPDKQSNYRYVLSQEYKRKYCKYLRDYMHEVANKIISVTT